MAKQPHAAGYKPNVPKPVEGDETRELEGILREVKHGCPAGERARNQAQELQDWYDGDSEKFVSFKPSEDALSWLTRPKRVSLITRQAVNKLTSHLYKPGPASRTVTTDDQVDAWYRRVAQDLQLNGVMKKCDQLAHLQGYCAVGLYPTRTPRRPVNYHLFPRTDFELWTDPADPRVPVALCTISKVDQKTTRFRLWTAHAYYTFLKGKDYGYTPGGWGVARFVPDQSGPHGYGCLPFVVVTHELPTTSLETPGVGALFSKINKALNIDMSNLALWVHHYGRPLGYQSGGPPDWRPKFVDGGFVNIPMMKTSTETPGTTPTLGYLQAQLDIAGVWNYIRGQANASLAELDVPLTTTVQSDNGGGTMGASGLAIIAQDADLYTYAKARQPVFERHESAIMALACRVGASDLAAQPEPLRARLRAAADDPALRVVWPEVYPDLPSTARDDGDQWELENDLTDPVELLMRRRGLTEPEAFQAFSAVQRRKAQALRIIADAQKAAETAQDGPGDEDGGLPGTTADGPAGLDQDPGDMGVDPCAAGAGACGTDGVNPSLGVSTAVELNTPIPAGPIMLPATPGMGGFGTEV